MAVEIEPLRGFGREAQVKRKWNKLWIQIGARLLKLPNKEQNILLEDFLTAIESRLSVMERITDAKRGN